mmetsp:Transcript_113046/g.314640  ORF Transcript_113046/g.314640 Transcript_113046/m.314640 type:complete len:337 (+) Transcript_113046:39-1049(+)
MHGPLRHLIPPPERQHRAHGGATKRIAFSNTMSSVSNIVPTSRSASWHFSMKPGRMRRLRGSHMSALPSSGSNASQKRIKSLCTSWKKRISAAMITSQGGNGFGQVSSADQSTSAKLTGQVIPLSATLRRARFKASTSRSVNKTSLAPATAAHMPGTPTPQPSSTTDLPRTNDGQFTRNCPRKAAAGHTARPVSSGAPFMAKAIDASAARESKRAAFVTGRRVSSAIFSAMPASCHTLKFPFPGPIGTSTRTKPSSSGSSRLTLPWLLALNLPLPAQAVATLRGRHLIAREANPSDRQLFFESVAQALKLRWPTSSMHTTNTTAMGRMCLRGQVCL